MKNKPRTFDVIILIVWCCLITARVMIDVVIEDWSGLYSLAVGLWFGVWVTIYARCVFHDRD